MRDSDGFVILERIISVPPSNTTPEKISKKEKNPKKPFKKGSWKNWLLKKLRKFKSPPSVKSFHFSNSSPYSPKTSISNCIFSPVFS